MRLAEVCEPIFQWIALVNRSSRRAAKLDTRRLRAEVKALFQNAESAADRDPRLSRLWSGVRMPLMYFVDSMVRSCPLPSALDWLSLQEEHGEMAGDDRFFDALDAALQDHGDGAGEKLEVFYNCLGLGFTGRCRGDPDEVRRWMERIAERASPESDAGDARRLCAEAYEGIDSRNLGEPIGGKLGGLLIGLAGMMVALYFVCVWAFRAQTSHLSQAIDKLDAQTALTAPSAVDGAKGQE